MPLSLAERDRLDDAVARMETAPAMQVMRVRQALLLIFLLMATAVSLAREVPYLSGRVVDDATILSPEARQRIAQLSRQHEEKTTNQIAVLTVPTLDSESIEDFAVRVFEHWKLGQRGKDNGVLLVIAPTERVLRIEVGYGLEGTLPDVVASRIIRDVITPQFKNGDFDAGVSDGLRSMISVLEGGAPPAVERASSSATAKPSPVPRILEFDLPIRVVAACVIFGALGTFTFVSIVTPGGPGWLIYVITLPFWAWFPRGFVGTRGTLVLLGIYLVSVAVTRVLLARSGWYKKMSDASIWGGTGLARFSSGSFSVSRGWSSGRSRGSSRSRGFSGGGGRSGGGGASGRW